MKNEINQMLEDVRKNLPVLLNLTTEEKNKVLLDMAKSLREHTGQILQANRQDVKEARDKISSAMVDRLYLDEARIEGMAKGIEEVVELEDPIGKILEVRVIDQGLELEKRRVPLGLVSVIYESRPNVTADVSALCFKSGNAVVLRGGREAYRSNLAILNALRGALKANGLSENMMTLLDDPTREGAMALMEAVGLVDLLIPRGGAKLIENCRNHAKVPLLLTGTGICHIYVDRDADLLMAKTITKNAKTSRPSVCNAMEVCVVDRAIAKDFLPMLYDAMVKESDPAVTLYLDEAAAKVISGEKALDEDFHREFLDYQLAVRVVDGIDEAIDHIRDHSTGHSDGIITQNSETAEKFVTQVDSAAVYVNASTRFTDGGVFGLGAEIGISTQKLHARGPMGLEALTSYKYIVRGKGQIRE